LVLAAFFIHGTARGAGHYGEVAFANSGASAAQADFTEGLALLHDFEYPLAAAAFQRAETADPGFAMAYWGEAMTLNHAIWMQQNLAGARAALNKLAPSTAERLAKAKTDRERAYLEAVEILYGKGGKFERDRQYEEAMRKVHERYPDDIDASAFYGLAVLGTAHAGRDTAIYMRAASVLEDAWLDHREHPGLVHYLIHCYDDPAHAPLGLRTARIYGRIAPDAPHALHMTSHIFLALGMWPETVDANVAAIRSANDRRVAQGKKAVHWGHYPLWLAYAYLQLGKADEARRMLMECRADVEAEADSNPAGSALDPDESASGALANMRLRYLIDTGNWQSEAVSWPAPKTLGPRGRLDFAFADVLTRIGRGQSAEARTLLIGLEATGQEVTREAENIPAESGPREARPSEQATTKQANPDPTEKVRPEILLLQARGLLAELDGDLGEAEKLLSQAAGLEERLPIAFGPPTIEKPTHELLGQFLLRHGRAGEARVQFEKALTRTPGRRVARQGWRAAEAVASPSLAAVDERVEEPGGAVPENDPICGLPARH
jgi:tetratricopeptide (TPR) repeat protein